MLLAKIIKELDQTNTDVFKLKHFVKTVLSLAEKGEYEKIKTVIDVMNPQEALDNLNAD
jgi:hypothetical protein